MTGTIGVLNVGAGDTRLTFDKNNPAEAIRSGRIVQDMLRRGYALLIEVPDGKGGKTMTRVKEFDPATNEYIIADLDPIQAAAADEQEVRDVQSSAAPSDREAAGEGGAKEPSRLGRPRKGPTSRIPASGTSGVAVSRSAGG